MPANDVPAEDGALRKMLEEMVEPRACTCSGCVELRKGLVERALAHVAGQAARHREAEAAEKARGEAWRQRAEFTESEMEKAEAEVARLRARVTEVEKCQHRFTNSDGKCIQCGVYRQTGVAP